MKRKLTKQIHAGTVAIGGGAAVSVQSMTTTDTRDAKATLAQIARLEQAGCDIVRVAVPDLRAAKAIYEIKQGTKLPVVADIHFDYRLALEAVSAGADKIRINPGNIGSAERVKAVADTCRLKSVPIRIGINGGSLHKGLLEKYGGVTPQALVESAKEHIELLNRFDFDDICVSIKASSVPITVEACRLMSELTDYPLHLGVTEAGTPRMGLIKSAAGIGGLLSLGIGDTIRVSLTADPVEEVIAGIALLKAVGAEKGRRGNYFMPDVRSLPGGYVFSLQRGGRQTFRASGQPDGRRHGLRRKRTGRGVARGCGYCLRRRGRTYLP